MDGPRFPAFARPALRPVSRRTMLRGMAGGLAAAALVGPRLAPTAGAAPAAQPILPRGIGNPANRILLPGDGNLTDFRLDFTLTGPPAVFFSAGDTPGWSPDLATTVSGFAFGYAGTLARPKQSAPGRAVQACVHHGFPSEGDADVAWFSLTTALASGGNAANADARINSLDVVEVVTVSGHQAILASVDADQFDAVVLASRAGANLVTVAIADFTGDSPTIDDALDLAEIEAAKLAKLDDDDRSDLKSAFAKQWTPGFSFGGADAPFFAWPVVLGGEPIPMDGDSSDSLALRRQLGIGVQFQSHIEGPFVEHTPAFADHGLYYSGQSNFFGSSGDAKSYHQETSARLRAGLPGITLQKPATSRNERRYPYKVPSSLGTLNGLMLHRVVTDGDYPLSFALHVITVPWGQSAPALDLDEVTDRLESLLKTMADEVETCLVDPHNAPLVAVVPSPA